jgi:hypothetical protein
VTPTNWLIQLFSVHVITEHGAKLLAALNLSYGRQWTCFKGNIVRIVDHGHEVAEKSRHAYIHAHMCLISGRPEGKRVFSEELGSRGNGSCNFVLAMLEGPRFSNGFGDEDLEQGHGC